MIGAEALSLNDEPVTGSLRGADSSADGALHKVACSAWHGGRYEMAPRELKIGTRQSA
jgi:hypothetical protein